MCRNLKLGVGIVLIGILMFSTSLFAATNIEEEASNGGVGAKYSYTNSIQTKLTIASGKATVFAKLVMI